MVERQEKENKKEQVRGEKGAKWKKNQTNDQKTNGNEHTEKQNLKKKKQEQEECLLLVKKENKTIAFSGLSKCISHNLPEVSPRGGTEKKILREERKEECAREPIWGQCNVYQRQD